MGDHISGFDQCALDASQDVFNLHIHNLSSCGGVPDSGSENAVKEVD